jgi:hypothetical protein
VGYKIPQGLPKLFLLSLILGIVFVPTLFGSFCIAVAVIQLAGWHLGANIGVLIVLLLWAVLVLGVVGQIARVIRQRTEVHA